MKILLIIFVILFTVSAKATVEPHKCVYIGSAIGYDLRQQLSENKGFDNENVDLRDSHIELLENVPVTLTLAKWLARKDIVKFTHLDYIERLKDYTEHNARNLIMKYIYRNKQGKVNIYIVSAIVNDNQCWLSFNGYLTVSREF